MLIVIDGIDGSGKTTQTQVLIRRLKAHKLEVHTLKFPQYTQNFFGGMVGQFLKGEFGGITDVDPHLASVLYALDRFESKEKLESWLAKGDIVVLDRYTVASTIHQTIKLPTKKQAAFICWLEKMEYQVLELPKPDLVLYLYLPYKLAYGLITNRGNKKDIHEADLSHLKNAGQHGRRLAKMRHNWHLIECHRGHTILSRSEIAQKIWSTIEKKL